MAPRRGRRVGYSNYSVQEQLLLCSAIGIVMPLGRNTWEQVARIYNNQRKSTWLEREHDLLKRKFRNLYKKPKPSGNNGEKVAPRLKAVLWAHELHHNIEKRGGAQDFTMGATKERMTSYLLGI
ncbi:hypothetical protein V7S43_018547 [Phytophthora oleae]|uniref:DUF6818 domain-containing protein n=1 Tax=Phytophthora oleae TaxID=2107226 RepID=A0ABD3EUD6_9STRA